MFWDLSWVLRDLLRGSGRTSCVVLLSCSVMYEESCGKRASGFDDGSERSLVVPDRIFGSR